MAITRQDVALSPYVPRVPPMDDTASKKWAYDELRKVAELVNQMAASVVQVAEVEPRNPLNGWQRLAKGAWATTLGVATTGTLVIYRNGAWAAV